MRRFELVRRGDRGWDVREYERSYGERYCTFRGDISPVRGLRNAVYLLRRSYPGCRIRVER